MLFNLGKRKCLHTGHGNLDVKYKVGFTVLGKGKGLRSNNKCWYESFRAVWYSASKGNTIFGLIRRNITYKKKANYTCV